MIDWKEGEAMPFPIYKRTFWKRMLAWWKTYGQEHPERREFVNERIAVAESQLERWK